MSVINHQIVLASRPSGAASADNFRMQEATLMPLQDGQVRVQNHFLSLDPYMRGRMNDARSYAKPQALNEVMIGATAGVVTESNNPAWSVGDTVVAGFGWQEYGTGTGDGMRRVDASTMPLSAYLGAAGMPGVTAWIGLNRICAPKSGETVAVSAASGAVGSVVGQLARQRGCRVVGIAGGAEKCGYVTGVLGFDACVDYKAGDLDAALQAAAPGGIDAYFDNVGGPVLDAVMLRLNDFARVAVCGAIAGYDGAPMPMANPALILRSRLLMQGFIVSERMEDWPQALSELASLLAAGTLKYRETVAHGLAAAPEAFLGLLKGRNFGKQIVKLV